jgi:hypothetical protein
LLIRISSRGSADHVRRKLAYDNSGYRTQDAAFLADALELSAAGRPNFALRMTFETADNRPCRNDCIRSLASLRRLEARQKVQKRRSSRQILYTRFCWNGYCQKEALMAETIVTLRLNQQQLELMDRTIAQGVAPDRVALVRLALREYAAARKADAVAEAAR